MLWVLFFFVIFDSFSRTKGLFGMSEFRRSHAVPGVGSSRRKAVKPRAGSAAIRLGGRALLASAMPLGRVS